jgi:hypothetical protein
LPSPKRATRETTGDVEHDRLRQNQAKDDQQHAHHPGVVFQPERVGKTESIRKRLRHVALF